MYKSGSTPVALAAMFGVGLFGVVFGRKWGRAGRALTMLCFVVLAACALGITACSGSVNTTSSASTTPTGTYPVSITAQQVGSVSVPGSNGSPVTVYGSENQMSLPYTLQVNVQ